MDHGPKSALTCLFLCQERQRFQTLDDNGAFWLQGGEEAPESRSGGLLLVTSRAATVVPKCHSLKNGESCLW